MPRYGDEPPYARPREAPRNDRDGRRPIDPLPPRDRDRDRDYHRMDDPMDVTRMERIDPNRMDPTRMDTNRMDPRPEPRANTGRPVRGDPRDTRAQEVIYRDAETGAIYPGAPPPPSRRTPYADEFDDLKPSTRPIIDPGLAPGQPKPAYNEYFVPGEGIDREVIQREICRYLGQDATCRPGKADDGRQGFIVRAYRALTSEMIRSLRESSEKFWSEKERRRRAGRVGDVAYSEIQDNRDYYYDSMDMDVDDRAPMSRLPRDLDPPAHARPQIGNRHGPPPVTSAYIQDPGYPAYALSSAPPGQYGLQHEPRTYVSGNTPPPPAGMRPPHPSFPAQPVYPSRTTPTSTATMPAPSYRDQPPERIGSYPYTTDRSHRR